MPIYSYKCIYCDLEFDEFRKMNNSGKSRCLKCGNVSFKIPAIFSAQTFKKREFADGTSTPDFVRTQKQEKAWMKSEGITYDAPTVKRKKKNNNLTSMEYAFASAIKKAEQGYRIENPKQRGIKNGNVKRIA